MGRVLSIAHREMRSYFNSPVAYIVLGVFLLVIGYLYFSALYLTGFASLRNFFNIAPVLLVVFAPALCMRLIAEERKSGTIENLLFL
jgi:ABC-2 type transport system permease protein